MHMQRFRVLLATAGLLLALAVPALAEQRVALVIGNATYAHAPRLANPLNDAADIGDALNRLGFAVTELENADYATLRQGLLAFTRAASSAEVAVVFYAGHGIEVDQRNFLVPVDARLSSDQDVEFETVPLELVMRSVGRASDLRLVILDACRDNPFAVSMQRSGATRSVGRGLARVEPAGETLVAYAAKGGTVAADGEGRNSPYSAALLAHLEEPGLEVGLLFRKVRDAVLATTGGRQKPFVYGSLSSRGVYLTARAEPDAGPVPVSPTTDGAPASDRLTAEQLAAQRLTAERELLFWESVKDSTNPADIQAYLDRYPGGTYEVLARNRLQALQGAGSAAAPQATAESAEDALGLGIPERRLIQLGLAAEGFDPGDADGLFGRKTRGAIGRWQSSRGEQATGHLDVESAKLLLAAGREHEAQQQAATRQAAAEAERLRREQEARQRAQREAQERARREAEERARREAAAEAERHRREREAREKARREAEARQKWAKLGLVMVRVEGGNFEIGKYEVTQALWQAVMGDNSSYFKGCSQCPVESVSWNDVQTFLRKLNRLTGKQYRLPTVVEWRYAARGGQKSRGYRFAGSNQPDSVAWYRRTSNRRTHPVGQKQPNELGLHDMHGNVSEWLQGRLADGGSWYDLRTWLNLDRPPATNADASSPYVGFRIARPLAP